MKEQLLQEFSQNYNGGQRFVDSISSWAVNHGIDYFGDVLAALVILIVGALAIKLIVASITKVIERSRPNNTLVAKFIRNVTAKCCWAVLIVVVLGKLGVNVGPIVAGLGVTGFILGFAFQESLGNLASGMMIAINEPFKIGDYVIVAGLEGTVQRVDMMATVLTTLDNKKIVIPNKSAWGSPITNFSSLGVRRVDLKVGVDYSTNLADAIKIAVEALKHVPNVVEKPEPSVSVASFDDSQITLNIRPWTESANYWAVVSDAQLAIKVAFDQKGVNIPFPQVVVRNA